MTTRRYEQHLAIAAPRERVYDAVATVEGVRGWWTPIVTGSGRERQLGFEGMDELIVLLQDEAERPARVRWTCAEHSGAEAWNGSAITFVLSETAGGQCELAFGHDGIAPDLVAPGWARFLSSLTDLAETGVGAPFNHEALAVAQRYHRAWTNRDFEAAVACLDEDLETDVPLNTYATKAEFAEALTRFGAVVQRAELLAALEGDGEALLLYDMVTAPFGTIRIAEGFTVRNGLITRIRHVHDTAALRAAGVGAGDDPRS
jgi:uncharacterized protein YndB with AHSA1/START domain